MIMNRLQTQWDQELAQCISPWKELSGTLAEVLIAIKNDPDNTLRILLAALAQGDSLAGYVVVVTMLPKIRRYAASGLPEDELIATLWIIAAEYPLATRPNMIAANLALDTRKRLLEQKSRDIAVSEIPAARYLDDTADEVTAREVLVAAEKLDLITPHTQAVLETVYHYGISGRVAAKYHQLSEVALRQRCSRALTKLASHSDELLALAA
ncbi:MAG: hypothetical protein ACRDAX_04195 [Propionibacteriaceae bacterium]